MRGNNILEVLSVYPSVIYALGKHDDVGGKAVGSDMGGSPRAEPLFFEKLLVNPRPRSRAAPVAGSVGADQSEFFFTEKFLYFPGPNKFWKIYREKVLVFLYLESVEFRGKLRRMRVVKSGIALSRARPPYQLNPRFLKRRKKPSKMFLYILWQRTLRKSVSFPYPGVLEQKPVLYLESGSVEMFSALGRHLGTRKRFFVGHLILLGSARRFFA